MRERLTWDLEPSPLTQLFILAIAGYEIAGSRFGTITKRHEWLSLFYRYALFSSWST
jgi:hypothetical protein